MVETRSYIHNQDNNWVMEQGVLKTEAGERLQRWVDY